MANKYLDTYLNDHLAGSTFGWSLAMRISRQNQGNPYGRGAAAIAEEIEEDRRALRRIMELAGVRERRVRLRVAWIGERLSRLKPNGKLIGYSPLSRVLELEALTMGITGKLELWRSLEAIGDGAAVGDIDLRALIARAEAQRERVEGLRVSAAREALGG